MKAKLRFLFFITCLCFFTACSKDDEFDRYGIGPEQCGSDKVQNHTNGIDQDRYLTMRSTGLRIHYRIVGKGPIDIVFVPGWTNPLEIFSKQFDYFRKKARCIYIDVPGQGQSDAPKGIQFSMGLMADAVYDVIKKEEVKKFVGVGFSMGPVPLGQFHKKHPGMMTKLVNLDGSFYPYPPLGDPSREQFIESTEAFCASIVNWGEAEKQYFGSLLVTDTAPEDLKEFVTYFYTFPSWLMANIYWNYTREEVNQPIGWKIPILNIYSLEPADLAYEQLYFPNADIHVLTGSGHCLQWEQPEIVNDLIWNFITDRPKRRH